MEMMRESENDPGCGRFGIRIGGETTELTLVFRVASSALFSMFFLPHRSSEERWKVATAFPARLRDVYCRPGRPI